MKTMQISHRERSSGLRAAATRARSLAGTGASRLGEIDRVVRRHRTSLLVVVALLGVTGAFHAIGMFENPQAIDDEGTYVAQAWAVAELRELAHYTYWYDHPPLGWLQLAVYAEMTGAFDRVSHAIYAGREMLLVTQLLSVGLLWVLCRRLRFARWSSAIAVLFFGLSPLAIQFHRVVFLDNIATPWILASFVLAASPRRRMAEVAGSALCFGIAVLTKETSLLLLPALAWLLWQSSDRTTRRYTLAVATSLFLAIGVAYLLFATVKGELMAGADRVSLFEGVRFQLAGREAGGSVFTAGTSNRQTLDLWLDLDRITPLLATVAAPLALFIRRLRPFAAGYLVMVLMLVRPGYLPVPFVIAVLPLAAVLIAGVADEAWTRRGTPSWMPARVRLDRPFAAPLMAVGAVVVVAAVPMWAAKHRGLFWSDPNQPVLDATAWISDNVPGDHRLMVDDVFYVDLVEGGFDRSNVVWTYKVDTDPAVQALSPRGWRDYDYLVETEGVRRAPDTAPQLAQALENSVVVARFGQDEEMVQIRRIVDGTETAAQPADAEADRDLRASVGAALDVNPDISTTSAASEALTSGEVDERLMVVLAAASQSWDLTLDQFPAVAGEEGIGSPRRVAIVTAVDGETTATAGRADLERWLNAQRHLGVAATPTADGLAISVPPVVPGQGRAIARTAADDDAVPTTPTEEETP